MPFGLLLFFSTRLLRVYHSSFLTHNGANFRNASTVNKREFYANCRINDIIIEFLFNSETEFNIL